MRQKPLSMLVNHDGEREIVYTAGAEKSLEAARAKGWTVISVKKDWKLVFLIGRYRQE
jgi:hypothetical protein